MSSLLSDSTLILRVCVLVWVPLSNIYSVASCTIVPYPGLVCVSDTLHYWRIGPPAYARPFCLLHLKASLVTRFPQLQSRKPFENSKPTTYLPYRSKASIRLHLRARKPTHLILTATKSTWHRWTILLILSSRHLSSPYRIMSKIAAG